MVSNLPCRSIPTRPRLTTRRPTTPTQLSPCGAASHWWFQTSGAPVCLVVASPIIDSAFPVGTSSRSTKPSESLSSRTQTMALADYYARNALAASQVLAGFDEERIRMALESVRVGLAIGTDAAQCSEGRALLDLLIRLL